MAEGIYCVGLVGGNPGYVDAIDANSVVDGDIVFAFVNGLFYAYQLDEDSGLEESPPDIIAPDNADGLPYTGQKRFILQRQPQTNEIPIGTIAAWNGGVFSSGNNEGFVDVLGNTVDDANAYLNPQGWYVCDGSELNLPGSAKYDGAGRYLPNLTDEIFLMGHVEVGLVGGNNTAILDHSLVFPETSTQGYTLSISNLPAHFHSLVNYAYDYSAGNYTDHNLGYENGKSKDTTSVGSNVAHSHVISSFTMSTDAAQFDNKPKFLSCLYIEKVI